MTVTNITDKLRITIEIKFKIFLEFDNLNGTNGFNTKRIQTSIYCRHSEIFALFFIGNSAFKLRISNTFLPLLEIEANCSNPLQFLQQRCVLPPRCF